MHADYITDQHFTDIVYAESDVKYKEYENCTFINCDFRACSFIAVTFIDCNFLDCNFKGTKINHVSLRDVWFTKCDFTSVNFAMTDRSEEHTSELQSHHDLVCRLLLEKKKK